jgi:lipoprotein-releasing system ATP-binding protein
MVLVENITKEYQSIAGQDGALQVLRGINLRIGQGEIVAVVGASGAGKSTLLHILGTLDRPTTGRILYDGEDVFAYNDESIARFRNQHVGFVFQFHHLLPEFTVLENVCMPALIQGRRIGDVKQNALKLLRDVGVEGKALAKPTKLSGGEQQRVAVARALMNSPKVVLADEPSGNLDAANAQQLHGLIKHLCKSLGQTFVIVTHNEAFARESDRIIKIVDGIIAEI